MSRLGRQTSAGCEIGTGYNLNMRFECDKFAVSTWETDCNGNEIAGSGEQIDASHIPTDYYNPDSRRILEVLVNGVKEPCELQQTDMS